MSIDKVMDAAAEYRDASTFSGQCVAKINLRAAIDQHVAEAVAAEREACAKACETQSARWYLSPRDVYVAHECTAAIRARADHDEVTR